MKKVFAFLSVFALTIAIVGLTFNSSVAAEEKWVVDPTINENEIPMYIMNSIYTTFPQYYNNAEKADAAWGGASRMYPWNETRLQVKLIEDGKFTGKEYAIFFAGGTKADDKGAGNNLGFLVEKDGQIKFVRAIGGSNYDGFMDPSLSHLMTNMTGKEITISDYSAVVGSSQGGNYYNRTLVFDAQGRMIKGMAGDVLHSAPYADGVTVDENGEPVTIPAEFCYVNGVVTKIADGVVCDKIKEAQKDDTGADVVGEDGEPIMVDTDKDNKVYTRFVWDWVEAEKHNAESVNTVPYLSAGWDAQLWDYAWEQDGGVMRIAFVSGEGSAMKLRAEQLEVYTATINARNEGKEEAQKEALPDASTVRKMAKDYVIPAGGYVYDFGYLDKGISDLAIKYVDMFIDGFKYGRLVDAEGNGMGRKATYNFSAKPIYNIDAIYEGHGYRLMNGQQTIEVEKGQVISPAKSVDYSGLGKYWAVDGDFTSYKSDLNVVDLEMKVNGITEVTRSRYTSFDEMAVDFLKDVNDFMRAKNGGTWTDVAMPVANGFATGGEFYQKLNNEIATTNATYKSMFADATYRAKWSWLIDFINAKLAAAGQTDSVDSKGVLAGSPGNFTASMYCFLARNVAKPSWPSSKVDWATCADEWVDSRTVAQKWAQFTIDTTLAEVDTNYVVTYIAKNAETNVSSEYTIKYVVVDEYTPVIKVNKNATFVTPLIEKETVKVDPIDKYSLVVAKNGKYDGKDIQGADITYKVSFDSATLDFDKPTEGVHEVVATVVNQTKSATVRFNVTVEDMTAPRAFTRDLVLAYGADFYCTNGVVYAWDNVNGNLQGDANDFRNWCVEVTSGPAVDTTKPGEYVVELEIYDKTGNYAEVSYNVTVLPQVSLVEVEDAIAQLAAQVAKVKSALEAMSGEDEELSLESVMNELAAIKTDTATLKTQLSGVAEQVTGVQSSVNELGTKLGNVETKVNGVASSVAELDEFVTNNVKTKCGAKAALIVELLAATSLLVVFLKKKH